MDGRSGSASRTPRRPGRPRADRATARTRRGRTRDRRPARRRTRTSRGEAGPQRSTLPSVDRRGNTTLTFGSSIAARISRLSSVEPSSTTTTSATHGLASTVSMSAATVFSSLKHGTTTLRQARSERHRARLSGGCSAMQRHRDRCAAPHRRGHREVREGANDRLQPNGHPPTSGSRCRRQPSACGTSGELAAQLGLFGRPQKVDRVRSVC